MDDDVIVSDVCHLLRILSALYERQNQGADLTVSEQADIEVKSTASPSKRGGGGQGYGLSGKERRAVELRAMEVTEEYLKSLNFKVKDVSGNHSYDFKATKGDEEIFVEVKGTTSEVADSVLMTVNEVNLHKEHVGKTALANVSQIILDKRMEEPQASGGQLEWLYPWEIESWNIEEKAFLVSRPSE